MNKTEFKNLIEECIREVNEERDRVYLTDNEVAFILKENYVPAKRDRLLQEGKKKMSYAEAEAMLREEFEQQVDFVESHRLFKEAALRGPGGRFAKKTPPPETTTGSSATTYTTNVDASAGGKTPKGKKGKPAKGGGGRRGKNTPAPAPTGKGGRKGRMDLTGGNAKKRNSPARKKTAQQVGQLTVKLAIDNFAKKNPKELAALLKRLKALEAQGTRIEDSLKKLLDSPKVKKAKEKIVPEIAETPPAPIKPGQVPGAAPGGFFSRMVNFVKDNKGTILGTLGTIAAIGGAAALSSTGLGAMLAPALSSKTVRNALMGGAFGMIGGTIRGKMKGDSWKDSLKQGLKTGAKAMAGGALVGLGQDALGGMFSGGDSSGVTNRATSPDLGWSGDDGTGEPVDHTSQYNYADSDGGGEPVDHTSQYNYADSDGGGEPVDHTSQYNYADNPDDMKLRGLVPPSATSDIDTATINPETGDYYTDAEIADMKNAPTDPNDPYHSDNYQPAGGGGAAPADDTYRRGYEQDMDMARNTELEPDNPGDQSIDTSGGMPPGQNEPESADDPYGEETQAAADAEADAAMAGNADVRAAGTDDNPYDDADDPATAASYYRERGASEEDAQFMQDIAQKKQDGVPLSNAETERAFGIMNNTVQSAGGEASSGVQAGSGGTPMKLPDTPSYSPPESGAGSADGQRPIPNAPYVDKTTGDRYDEPGSNRVDSRTEKPPTPRDADDKYEPGRGLFGRRR
jgi:hypothetical protein